MSILTGFGLSIGSMKKKPVCQSPSITCPTVLELRQLLQYKPLSLEDRRVVTDVLQKYGKYVAERLKKSDSLLPHDPREESEKLSAEALNAKVHTQGHIATLNTKRSSKV